MATWRRAAARLCATAAVPVVGLLAVLAAVQPGDAAAQILCSEPIQPLCSVDSQGTADPTMAARCGDDVRNYRSDLREFRGCLEEAIEGAERNMRRAEEFLTCLEEDEDPEACRLRADPAL